MTRRTQLAAALLALSVAAVVAPVRAEDKPTFLRASIMLDETQKFLETLGLPLPVIKQLKGVESIPFIGEGNIDGSKPYGVVLVAQNPPAGGDIERLVMENVILSVPLKKDAGTVDKIQKALAANGGKADVKDNTVTTDGVIFRRLDNYLMWSASDTVTSVPDSPFKNDYAVPGTLFNVHLDFAAARKFAPKFLDAIWRDMNHEMKSGDPFENAVSESVGKSFQDILAGIDTASFGMSHDDKDVRFTTIVEPTALKAEIAALPRPTFLTPQLVELHVLYPNAKTATWVSDEIDKIDFSKLSDNADDNKKTKAILVRVVKLLTAADAVSIGVTLKDEMPTVMLVDQFSKDVDVTKEIHEIATDASAMINQDDKNSSLEVSEYSAGDQKITRVTMIDHKDKVFFVDFAQAGKMMAVTFSAAAMDGTAAKLLTAPADGKLTEFVSAKIDLSEAAESIFGMMPMGAGFVKKMKEATAGKAVTFTAKADAEGKVLTIEAAAPISVFKDISAAVGPILKALLGDDGADAPPPPPADNMQGK